MITRVNVRYFKKFEDQTIDLPDHVVLAGPNNSGKTTLLQAIVLWDLALRRWKAKRLPNGESGTGRPKAKQRTGVPITRKDFTALPLQEMNQLWTNTLTALKLAESEKPGQPRVLTISLTGKTKDDSWELGFEFRYQNTELIYVKPQAEHLDDLPKAVQDLTVVHVPPFSGIGPEETRYDLEYQNVLTGQGKPGDILRNLLLEVHQNHPADWDQLRKEIEEIFGIRLQPPAYEGRPYILCQYLPRIPQGKGKNGLPELDIATAGSGFLQVLTLFGFIYARPATVLLLDEPDAHLHVVLQKQIYDRLRSLASRRGRQVIIATHSEVIIDSTSPKHITSFYGKPHPLVRETEREQVREALKRLTAIDILLADRAPGVLYVEGQSDFDLLKAWAKVLDHRLYRKWFLKEPFWQSNQGRNPREARSHFFALRALNEGIKGFLLLDGDNRNLPDREIKADGLEIGRWTRYEAESYLIHPAALQGFLLKTRGVLPLIAAAADQYLKDALPPGVYRDPLGKHDYLNRTPASKTLLPDYFSSIGEDVPKADFYLIAEQMKPDEVAPEVTEKLDRIAEMLGI